jgi:predicted HTH domain antitoxin
MKIKSRIMVLELELENLFQNKAYSEKELRLNMAVILYQRHIASVNRAAKLSGLPLKAFEQVLQDRNIKLVHKPATLAEEFLATLSPNDPLREVIKPLRPASTTIEDIIKEQNYTGTNWDELNIIAQRMAIEEPIEVLLAQLKD